MCSDWKEGTAYFPHNSFHIRDLAIADIDSNQPEQFESW